MFGEINELARDTDWLHGPLLAYADYGVLLFSVLLVAGWWVARSRGARTVAAAIWAGVGTLVAVAVNQPLVNGFHEARPYTDHHSILVLAARSTDYSFPSDHAVMAGAVAAGLWLVDRRLAVVASIAAALMAFSRVYIAAHYPHDVLVGLAVGAAVVLVGWWLVARPLTTLVALVSATRLRPLVAADDGPTQPQRRGVLPYRACRWQEPDPPSDGSRGRRLTAMPLHLTTTDAERAD